MKKKRKKTEIKIKTVTTVATMLSGTVATVQN